VVTERKVDGVNLAPTTTSPITVEYFGLKPQASIHQTSIKCKIKNAQIKVCEDAPAGKAFIAGKNTVTITNAFANVEKNDVITLTEYMGIYTILEKIDDSNIKLKEYINATTPGEIPEHPSLDANGQPILDGNGQPVIIPAVPDPIKFYVSRIVPESNVELTAIYGSKSMTISGMIDSATKRNYINFDKSEFFISYIADRKDLVGFYEVNSIEQLKNDMDVDPANPLGYNLGVLMPLSGGSSKVYAFILQDDSDLSYIQALEDLEAKRNVYGVIAMKDTVNGAISSHAINVSKPEYSIFRNAYVSGPLVQSQVIISATCAKA
jgi:hypothetical protein